MSSVPLSLAPGGQADFSLEAQARANTRSLLSARPILSWCCLRKSMVNSDLWPVTMTAVRTGTPECPRSSFTAAAMWQWCGFIGPVNRDKQPSCTGSGGRRLRPPAEGRKETVKRRVARGHSHHPVWYEPAYVRGLRPRPRAAMLNEGNLDRTLCISTQIPDSGAAPSRQPATAAGWD